MRGRAVMVKKRAVGNMLSCLIGLLLIFIVLYYAVNLCATLNVAVKKTRIERSFMMQMETEGYLSPSAKSALIDELEELGVYNISLTGTTMVPAGYGNDVILSVQGQVKTNNIIGLSVSWGWIRGGDSEFKIYQKSTAKY